MDNPLVSVIIPTYNRASLLREAVDSVLGQDYSPIELIIIDDGSTDRTAELVKSYGERLVYRRQENRGVSSARNHGLRLARGEYICFLDSDDWWKKNKVSRQVSCMQSRQQVPLCYTDEIWIRKGVRVNPHKKHRKYGGYIFERCLPLCIISPSSAMFRRGLFAAVGEFDEDLPACEDYDLWLRVCRDHPVHFIPEALIFKRGGHPDQLSHKYWGNDRFRVRALEKLLLSHTLDKERLRMVKECLSERCRILAQGCFKRGKKAEGERYLQIIERWRGMDIYLEGQLLRQGDK